MEESKFVTLQHPAGKSPGKIKHGDYMAICNFVVAKIREAKTISLVGLIDSVEYHFKDRKHFIGDFRWMTFAVKLNLESEGLITTVYPKGRERRSPLLRLNHRKYKLSKLDQWPQHL